MAIVTEIDIAGTEGNMQAQPRVFSHDARLLDLTIPTTGGNNDPNAYVDVLPTGTPSAGDKVQVLSRGACLYIGGLGNVDVEMESGQRVTFKGVAAGSFLPILVTKVYLTDGATPSAGQTTTATDILALF